MGDSPEPRLLANVINTKTSYTGSSEPRLPDDTEKKPTSSQFLTDRSKVVLLLWIIFVIYVLCLSIVCAGAILKESTCLLCHITTEKSDLCQLIRGVHYPKHYIKKVARTEWL